MNLYELHQRAEAARLGSFIATLSATMEKRERRIEATVDEKRKWVESELRKYGFGDADVNSILSSCEFLNK